MSVENVELVRRLYGWMAAGEAEKSFEVYDPEIEWDSSQAQWLLDLGFDPLYRGHDEVRMVLRSWLEAWESIDYRPYELIDAGDDVLAFVRLTARGRSSGVEVVYDHPQLWTVRHGKIVRMRVFGDRDEAFAAAGLPAEA
jgi:ketosteroid isomerase-like protein